MLLIFARDDHIYIYFIFYLYILDEFLFSLYKLTEFPDFMILTDQMTF